MPKHLEVVTSDTETPVWVALRNQAEHAAKAEPRARPGRRNTIRRTIHVRDLVIFSHSRTLCEKSESRNR